MIIYDLAFAVQNQDRRTHVPKDSLGKRVIDFFHGYMTLLWPVFWLVSNYTGIQRLTVGSTYFIILRSAGIFNGSAVAAQQQTGRNYRTVMAISISSSYTFPVGAKPFFS